MGSTIDGPSIRSGAGLRPRPERRTIAKASTRRWPRDSHNTVSGIPGAVQFVVSSSSFHTELCPSLMRDPCLKAPSTNRRISVGSASEGLWNPDAGLADTTDPKRSMTPLGVRTAAWTGLFVGNDPNEKPASIRRGGSFAADVEADPGAVASKRLGNDKQDLRVGLGFGCEGAGSRRGRAIGGCRRIRIGNIAVRSGSANEYAARIEARASEAPSFPGLSPESFPATISPIVP